MRGASDKEWRTEATHLVVFQHGLLGNDADFQNYQLFFHQYFPTDEVFAYCAKSNATSMTRMFQTYDGIDTGGQRLADEIQQVAERLPRLEKLSVIGHSLGGLYARYCLGVLYARGFFEKIEPMNFITLASPHMGTRRTQRSSLNMIYNAVVPKLLDRTGQQFGLNDTPSEQTLALSRPARRYPDRPSNAACQEIDGIVLATVSSENKENEPPKPLEWKSFYCKISNRVLQVLEHRDGEASENESKMVMEVDLLDALVTVVVPDELDSTSKEESDKPEDQHSWDVELRPDGHAKDAKSGVVLTLRINYEQWKWLVAISNSSAGVMCRSPQSDVVSQALADPSTLPSTLLGCLTHGQFLQALQLFKTRTLYSSVFFDVQVPYSCGAIRAFNPYRVDAANCTTSPYYRHITMKSLWNAPLVRDTLPPTAKALPTEKKSIKNLLVKTLGERRSSRRLSRSGSQSRRSFSLFTSSSVSANGPASSARANRASFSSVSSGSSDGSSTPSPVDQALHQSAMQASPPHEPRHQPGTLTVEERNSWTSRQSSGVSSSFFSSTSKRNVPASRTPPFVDGALLLDHVHEAFSSDDKQRDALRGMMIALQSLGWRRIDVLFDNVLAHQKIVAKHANPAKPVQDGLDIVHHVMDTFLL
ncbi:hypothetical protein Poli38472_010041 [Pythium oligandrum]|uniref:DUF676 domain-containing protein n=1 Tax=Pythium oligandrum TaxID=41045 RepID=A0A8K1C9N1_PYTOL|nr:hypothetical protein Poli38472_010041 [Pythium oligandrum]|eukprot:TMW58482.1 hypothetical protein Poli38472_010041 [Pythium oligandrum]